MHHSRTLPEHMASEAERLGLGATGKFPEGKLHEDDEGEIKFAIAVDPNNHLIHLNFGKKVSFVSFGPAQAREIAAMLVRHAGKLEGK